MTAEDVGAILEDIREELRDIWHALRIHNTLLLAQMKIESGLEMDALYAILDEIEERGLRPGARSAIEWQDRHYEQSAQADGH